MILFDKLKGRLSMEGKFQMWFQLKMRLWRKLGKRKNKDQLSVSSCRRRFLGFFSATKGFGVVSRNQITECLKSANILILINRQPKGKFGASRGLRQGDPLLPFLVIVVTMSRLLERANQMRLLKRMVFGRMKRNHSHTVC